IPNSDIEVSGLTFQNGSGGAAFESNAGGLKIGDPNPISGGRILVERNIFRNNSATSNGFSQAVGGLLAATDGTSLIVRGNLFVNNSSPNAAAVYLYSNNAIDFSNNTVTGNHSTDTTAPIRVALAYITFGGLISSNNIYWGNATGPDEFDLSLSPLFSGVAGATLLHDDIQVASGTAASASGTLHVDPGFVGNGDFHLAPNSPLIDAGVNDPAGGVTGVDLDGAARIRGAAVDLGAYESSASVAGPAIGAGFSGNWFDPTAGQDGHGFQIEVLPDNGMLAIWFVFNPQGTAQSWIYAQGVYATGSNSVTVPAFLETGGRFPPNFNSSMLTTTPWGSLTFTFADCSNGTATWTSNTASAAAGYADVSFPIRRVTSLAGTSCP
ncbi:MAG TPA: choice-of-anchor Q domain-containing protein, partial [Rudaea sp.]|nr:choice-of-anchor Q domain-containing protein [Rudaea sp.]